MEVKYRNFNNNWNKFNLYKMGRKTSIFKSFRIIITILCSKSCKRKKMKEKCSKKLIVSRKRLIINSMKYSN